MHVGLNAVEVESRKSIAHPRPRPVYGSTINRHPTTPVSPTPLDLPLGIPLQQQTKSHDADPAHETTFAASTQRSSKSKAAKRESIRGANRQVKSDNRTLPPIRSSTVMGRFVTQDLPEIRVCAAPKCNRDLQRISYHPQFKGKIAKISIETETTIKSVKIPSHRLSGTPQKRTPVTKETKNEAKKMIDKSLCLKSVDLNKELEASSGNMPQGTNLTIALSRKPIVQRRKVDMLASKHDLRVVSLSHLPLREVYLKPETGSNKELINQQNRDRMTRILNWLKELSYLDEKIVEKSRYEVERSRFQLSDIKDPVVIW